MQVIRITLKAIQGFQNTSVTALGQAKIETHFYII